MSRRHLVEGTDQSNNIFPAISSEIFLMNVKEMLRIKTGKNFKEHASTSFSRQLPVCLLDLKGAL